MARAQSVIDVLEPADKVWAVVSDFKRWGRLFFVVDAEPKGWGERWTPHGTPAPGAGLDLHAGDRLQQQWRIDEWAAGRCVVASSRRWHARPGYAMESTFALRLSPKSAVETALEVSLRSRFSHPLAGLFLNAAYPLGRELRQIIGRFEQSLLAQLSGG